jgi:hypothetical protein
MTEETAYQWAIAALKPIELEVYQPIWEQSVGKVASTILQADIEAATDYRIAKNRDTIS